LQPLLNKVKKVPEQVGLAQGRDISRGTTLIATFYFKLPLITESINSCPDYGRHPSVPTTCSKHQLQSVFTYPLASARTNRRLSEDNHITKTVYCQDNEIIFSPSEDIFLSFVAFYYLTYCTIPYFFQGCQDVFLFFTSFYS